MADYEKARNWLAVAQRHRETSSFHSAVGALIETIKALLDNSKPDAAHLDRIKREQRQDVVWEAIAAALRDQGANAEVLGGTRAIAQAAIDAVEKTR